jgi:hypothetical protein
MLRRRPVLAGAGRRLRFRAQLPRLGNYTYLLEIRFKSARLSRLSRIGMFCSRLKALALG